MALNNNSGEILTLQFGEYANQVATHYWNLEAEYYDHTTEGKSFIDFSTHFDATSEKFLPRVVSYGLKGSFNDVHNYDRTISELVPTWEGKVERIEQERREISAYQQLLQEEEKELHLKQTIEEEEAEERWEKAIGELEEQAKVWADFQRVDFSPRSIFEFSDFKYSLDDSLSQRGLFSLGFDHLRGNSDDSEEVIERMRIQIEKMDNMKGVQVFTEEEGLFGGISYVALEHFRDYFSRSLPILSFSLSSSPVKSVENKINSGIAVSKLAEISSLLLPIDCTSLPLSFPKDKWFYSSAIAGLAINSITLPFRAKGERRKEIGEIARAMELPIAGLSVAFPFQLRDYLSHVHFPSHNPLFLPLHFPSLLPLLRTPLYSEGAEWCSPMMMNVRGVSDEWAREIYTSYCIHNHHIQQNISSLPDLLSLSLSSLSSPLLLSVMEEAMYLPISFPHRLFPKSIDIHGQFDQTGKRERYRVESIAVMSTLQSGAVLKNYLKATAEEFASLHKQPFYCDSFNRDHFDDIQNNLFSLSDRYN